MKILAISTNTGDATTYFEEESVQVDDLVQRGVIERVLLKADWSGAAVLLETADLETARTTLQALPIASHGLTQFELIPVVESPPRG